MQTKYDKIIERAKAGKSRKDSIHAHCLECMGWEREQVRNCLSRDCFFWRWRPYKTIPEVVGSVKKRQIKKKTDHKKGQVVNKIIQIDNPQQGRIRLKVEILTEDKGADHAIS